MTIQDILKAVAAAEGVSTHYIMQRSQKREVVMMRQMVMYLARKSGYSNRAAAAFFRLDHSTCVGGFQRIGGLMEIYPDVAARVRVIEELLERQNRYMRRLRRRLFQRPALPYRPSRPFIHRRREAAYRRRIA